MTANLLLTILKLALTCVLIVPGIVSAQSSAPLSAKKPNILVIWGDDIGWYNPSIYNRGDMGYSTPTSIASGRRAQCLPAGTDSRAAPQDAPRSLLGSRRFVLA